MNLTTDTKTFIDGLNYEQLLTRVRFGPVGDPWFQGETGTYWLQRINDMRAAPGGQTEHVLASKNIGWIPPRERKPV